MAHCRHRKGPYGWTYRATSNVRHRGVTLASLSLLTREYTPRVQEPWLSLKVRKSGDPTVPARGISSRTTGRVLPMYWSACPLLVSREICQTTKVELSKSKRETR